MHDNATDNGPQVHPKNVNQYVECIPCAANSLNVVGDKTENFSFLQVLYEGCLQNSWTHLIIPSRNFVEAR